MADMNALIRNPLVLGGVAVVVIAVGVGGYFLGTRHPDAPKTAEQAAADRGVCEATLDRVRNFGILLPTAKLASDDATKTDTDKRVTCSATSDGTSYTIAVDVLCDNMGDEKCLQLFKVTDSTGKTLFQRTKFLDPT